jgi:hypothetical protein
MAEPGREHIEARDAVMSAPHVPVVSMHRTSNKMLEKTLPASSRGWRSAVRPSPFVVVAVDANCPLFCVGPCRRRRQLLLCTKNGLL